MLGIRSAMWRLEVRMITIIYPEGVGNRLLRNVLNHLPEYMALCPIKPVSITTAVRNSNLKMLRLFFWNETTQSGRYLLPPSGLIYTHQTTRRHILEIYSLNNLCLEKLKFKNFKTAFMEWHPIAWYIFANILEEPSASIFRLIIYLQYYKVSHTRRQ
jgi:hypothetical protein